MPTDAEIQTYATRIANPGQIQSYGVLLLVDEEDGLRIRAGITRVHQHTYATGCCCSYMKEMVLESEQVAYADVC